MRAVLLALELTTNGAAMRWDPGGTSEPDWTLVDDNGRAKLDAEDAPHLQYLRRWNLARTGEEREEAITAAERALRAIRYSSGDRSATETKAERDRRIITEGVGLRASEVAVWARCGVSDVLRARAAGGRDLEYGRRPTRRATKRQAEVLKLFGQGLSARQIATVLGLSYNTVRRALGKVA